MENKKKTNEFKKTKNKINYPKNKKRIYNQMINNYKNDNIDEDINCNNHSNKVLKLNSDNDFIKNNKIHLHQESFIIKNFDVKENYFILNRDINYDINIPNNVEFKAYEEKSENNYKLIYEILKHLNLKVNSVKEINIQKDGNCFYNNLSFFYTNTQEYNFLFRFILFKYCSDYIEEIRKEHPLIFYYGKNYKTKDYIKKIKNKSFFLGILKYPKLYMYLS